MFGLTPINRNALRLNETDPFRNLIDEVLGDAMLPIRSLRHDTFKIDVREEGDAFMIDADLPGFAKEDIAISYEDGDLAIEVKKDEEKTVDHGVGVSFIYWILCYLYFPYSVNPELTPMYE